MGLQQVLPRADDALARQLQVDDARPAIAELPDEGMTRRIWPGRGELDLMGFAEAVKASPIRFVGPAVTGGGGELAFGR